MRKIIATTLIISLLILTVMMNAKSLSYNSKSDYQAALNSNIESVQLDESELIFEGGRFNWRRAFCIGMSTVGIAISVGSMLTAPATGGAGFWLGFMGYQVSKATLIGCFLF